MHALNEVEKLKGHMETQDLGENTNVGLTQIQTALISGALKWKQTTAGDVYKKLSKVYTISADRLVDEGFMEELRRKNYSRIPVYYGDKDRQLIFGILLTRSLIGLKLPSEGEPPLKVSDIISRKMCKIKNPPYVKTETKTEHILQCFKQGQVHMSVLVKNPDQLVEEAEAVVNYLRAPEDRKEEMKASLD